MNPCTGGRRGMTLLELLVVVILSGMLLMAGLGGLGSIMHLSTESFRKDAQQNAIGLEVTTLQRMLDQAIRDPFHRGPWLVVECERDAAGFVLRRLSVRLPDERDVPEMRNWPGPERHLIRINLPSGAYGYGMRPDNLLIQFPDASVPIYREGVAIEWIW